MVSSESRNGWMRQIAVMDVHLAEFGAAMESGDALAGIEQGVRVESGLDCKEALELAGAELHAHLGELLAAHAGPAGSRDADFDAKLEDRRAERLGARHLALRIGVVQDQRVQVAVASMEDVRAAKSVMRR